MALFVLNKVIFVPVWHYFDKKMVASFAFLIFSSFRRCFCIS